MYSCPEDIRYAVTRGSRGSLKQTFIWQARPRIRRTGTRPADGACQQGCGRAWWLRRLGDPGPELLVEPFAGLVTRQVHDLAQPPLTPRRTTQRDAPIPGDQAAADPSLAQPAIGVATRLAGRGRVSRIAHVGLTSGGRSSRSSPVVATTAFRGGYLPKAR